MATLFYFSNLFNTNTNFKMGQCNYNCILSVTSADKPLRTTSADNLKNTQGNSGELREVLRGTQGTQGNSRELRGSKLQLIKNNVD